MSAERDLIRRNLPELIKATIGSNIVISNMGRANITKEREKEMSKGFISVCLANIYAAPEITEPGNFDKFIAVLVKTGNKKAADILMKG